eukprot:TRINITY_DN67282_c6_g1_i1.p1 TRINITY_DN67282_c6_g1~~TRINITY_DN67282_c6_g1_i1.p1  ORF type:complete len:397 (+),score=47.80 TRINITY_DN67282_c6_g1_i1:33-1193(+)
MADQSKKPADTPFKQQRLPAWQPILSPPWVITCFFLVAAIFIPIGVLIIVATGEVVEVEVRYDKNENEVITPPSPLKPIPPSTNPDWKPYLTYKWATIEVPEDMNPPVYMYYKLDNFYQNHRRYTKSRSDKQLSGGNVGMADIGDCSPFRYAGEVYDVDKPEDDQNIYAPCGLIAYSMFNDTFHIYEQTGDEPCNEPSAIHDANNCPLICATKTTDKEEEKAQASFPNIQCTFKNIAWSSDRNKKFDTPYDKPYITADSAEPYYYNEGPIAGVPGREGHLIPSQTDEDFMVWMRTASLPTFRKLYRIFPDRKFEKGTKLWILVSDRYDVSSFGGEKFVILSTTTWIGGKNYFLGVAYVVIGCVCFVLALIFFIKHLTGSRASNLQS